MSAPKILRVHDGKTVTHYIVSAGKPGRPNVTVRIGQHGVYACLTCLSVDCPHVACVRLPASTPSGDAA